jgi:limonene-1,2-epoxide hydrolase
MGSANVIKRFLALYENLDSSNIDGLADIYDSKVQFIDAIHEISGIEELKRYFEHLYHDLKQCDFDIKNIIEGESEASIIWVMHFSHPKISNGKLIAVDGCSHIKYQDKIYYHRDYFDVGQMLYEHLPLFGGAVRFIKRQISQ